MAKNFVCEKSAVTIGNTTITRAANIHNDSTDNCETIQLKANAQHTNGETKNAQHEGNGGPAKS